MEWTSGHKHLDTQVFCCYDIRQTAIVPINSLRCRFSTWSITGQVKMSEEFDQQQSKQQL